jgi:isopentenyl diphosphate isomerase/L-lactate dehydrogenase-like FMN-dependent dehydrogenase
MVGRPTLFGTAVGGQAGAAHVIEILRRELRTTMALAGRPRLADIDADLVGKASNLLGLQATPQLRRAAE